MLRFNTIPLYGCLILSLGTGLLVALFSYFVFVPHLRRKIDKEFELETLDSGSVEDSNTQKGITMHDSWSRVVTYLYGQAL